MSPLKEFFSKPNKQKIRADIEEKTHLTNRSDICSRNPDLTGLDLI